MEVANVVAITVICYVVGMLAKAVKKIPDDYIPVIVAVAGALLGAAGMYVIPDYPAADIINAVAVGIVSGLASTGVNQIKKHLGQK